MEISDAPLEVKNYHYFDILVSIPTKHHMEMTNINFFLTKSFDKDCSKNTLKSFKSLNEG
jgi:hypothetical protein